jgi:hypothetical protein
MMGKPVNFKAYGLHTLEERLILLQILVLDALI